MPLMPAVEDLIGCRLETGDFGKLVHVVDGQHMRAVKIRAAVVLAQVERVVAVEKQSQGAAFVQRMRIRIRSVHHETVAEALGRLQLQGVIRRNAVCLVKNGVGIKANEGHAKIRVASGKALDAFRRNSWNVVSIGESLSVD